MDQDAWLSPVDDKLFNIEAQFLDSLSLPAWRDGIPGRSEGINKNVWSMI